MDMKSKIILELYLGIPFSKDIILLNLKSFFNANNKIHLK